MTRELKPVCGVDSKTYPNPSHLKCAKVKLRYRGPCKKDQKPCVCNKKGNPVCGKDGKTYGNPCLLKCAKVKFAYKGRC